MSSSKKSLSEKKEYRFEVFRPSGTRVLSGVPHVMASSLESATAIADHYIEQLNGSRRYTRGDVVEVTRSSSFLSED